MAPEVYIVLVGGVFTLIGLGAVWYQRKSD